MEGLHCIDSTRRSEWGTDVAPPVTWEDYARAERFLPWNAAKLLHSVELTPHWIDDGDTFWYRTTRRDGVQFVKVDPEKGTREPAFDHVRLAAAPLLLPASPMTRETSR